MRAEIKHADPFAIWAIRNWGIKQITYLLELLTVTSTPAGVMIIFVLHLDLHSRPGLINYFEISIFYTFTFCSSFFLFLFFFFGFFILRSIP